MAKKKVTRQIKREADFRAKNALDRAKQIQMAARFIRKYTAGRNVAEADQIAGNLEHVADGMLGDALADLYLSIRYYMPNA